MTVTSFELQLSSPALREITYHSLSFSHQVIAPSQEETIPLSLFGTDLGVLETICVYLHDSRRRSWTEIGLLLHRSPKTIFAAYHHAKKKQEGLPNIDESGLYIPLSAFKDTLLGPLEALSVYLFSVGISPSMISLRLNRNVQTIFTSLRRARAKQEQRMSS